MTKCGRRRCATISIKKATARSNRSSRRPFIRKYSGTSRINLPQFQHRPRRAPLAESGGDDAHLMRRTERFEIGNGQTTRARHFGLRLEALVTYLHHEPYVSFERVQLLAQEVFGLALSEGRPSRSSNGRAPRLTPPPKRLGSRCGTAPCESQCQAAIFAKAFSACVKTREANRRGRLHRPLPKHSARSST